MSDAAVLLRPLRARILEMLAEPQSAATVARRLSVARQKVGYHLKELEKDGLVELVEQRKSGNCVERIVRATGRAYLVSAEALGSLAHGALEGTDRFSAAYVIAVAARAIRELAKLRHAADDAGKRLATLTLETEIRFANAVERASFAEELAREIARLTAKYHDASAPRGRMHRIVSFAYPKPAESEVEKETERHEPHDPPRNP
jgi:DNA-binding transcriptional ArsR family regulator